MQSQFRTEDEFKKALDARGMTLDKLKSDTRIDMSINKMVESEVSSQPAPTDAECREFYDKNPDKFKQDESVRASHILFRVDEKADRRHEEESHGPGASRPEGSAQRVPTSPSWRKSTRPTAARSRAAT